MASPNRNIRLPRIATPFDPVDNSNDARLFDYLQTVLRRLNTDLTSFNLSGTAEGDVLVADSDLIYQPTKTLSKSYAITQNLAITSGLTVGANVAVTGTLTATGNATFGANFSVAGSGSITGDLTVGDDLTVTDLLTVQNRAVIFGLLGLPPESDSESLLQLGFALNTGDPDGTYIGINSPTGFEGEILRFQINSSDRLRLDYKGRIISTGVLGTNEVAIELTPSSVASNSVGYKFTIPGTPTAPIQVFYGVGSVEHNIEAKIENQNTNVTYAHAKMELRTFSGGGDPFMHFAIQSGTEWAVGADNDFSDRFTVASTSQLASSQLLVIQTDGDTMVGHGSNSAGARLDVLKETALTDSIQAMLLLTHNTTGSAAAGFGARQRFALESSGSAGREALDIDVTWVTATDASRAARGVIYAYDTAARECIRVEASGTAPMVSFLGAAAAAQQTGGAQTAGATWTSTEQGMLQTAYDALRTFGFLT